MVLFLNAVQFGSIQGKDKWILLDHRICYIGVSDFCYVL